MKFRTYQGSSCPRVGLPADRFVLNFYNGMSVVSSRMQLTKYGTYKFLENYLHHSKAGIDYDVLMYVQTAVLYMHKVTSVKVVQIATLYLHTLYRPL